ncbi:hypothetical protein L2E82_04583 [Cichorium intybus]|uniref:Uncharacterized protein n=1 Tax=Cichorium intybus TaxID=13427 RepID=A0ACB9H7V3_CICIN|nr:hypothetical protein L2E82_04583 [Cichorium intybus]
MRVKVISSVVEDKRNLKLAWGWKYRLINTDIRPTVLQETKATCLRFSRLDPLLDLADDLLILAPLISRSLNFMRGSYMCCCVRDSVSPLPICNHRSLPYPSGQDS